MLDEMIEEIGELKKAKELLDLILGECAGYAYKIDGMSNETHNEVIKYTGFNDGE